MKSLNRNLFLKTTSLLFSLVLLLTSFQNCSGGYQAINQDNSQASLSSSSLPTLSVVLSWDKSASPNIQGYRIYLGSVSGAPDKVIDVGPTSSPDLPEYEILNLDPQLNYFAVVTAYDVNGRESLASNQIEISAK